MRGHVTVYGNLCRPNIQQIRCVSFGPGETCDQKAKFIQNDIATVALFLVEWTSFLRNLANFELHLVFFVMGIRILFWSRVLIALACEPQTYFRSEEEKRRPEIRLRFAG